MSKGLESLEKLDDVLCDIEIKHKENLGFTKPFTRTIKKELKALEIIKKKRVNIQWLEICIAEYEKNALGNYNSNRCLFALTQEEFDLLKEVLCDE